MNLLEVGILTPQTLFSYVAPFVGSCKPLYKIVDSSLIAIFPDEEDNRNRIFINGFVRGPFVNYQVADSYANCVSTEKSIYWDHDNQFLYIHFEHSYYYDTDNYSYETYDLYNDLDVVYIDGQESLPLLTSAPTISKQQDLVNYEMFALNSGTAVLNNINGELDKHITDVIYGNTVFNSYIDPDDIQTDETGTKYADRDDIVRLSAYYINNFGFSLSEFTLDLKDPRGRQNVSICTDLYTVAEYPDIADNYLNKPIQLVFGQCREITAVPVDGENTSLVNPRFRAGLEITDFGTIQVLQDKTWTTVTPILTQSNGEFVLFGTDALDADGAVLDCRLLGATGVEVVYGSDPIKWLNEYYSYIDYNDSFYDTDEWESESDILEPIGIVFGEKIKLYEAIKKIQSGCNHGFRYDYNNEGKITLRLDREDRPLTAVIDNLNLQNRFELNIESDREQTFSFIDVSYNPSFSGDDKIELTTNSDWLSYQQTTRQQERLPVETYLITEAAAEQRAALDALRFRDVPRIATLVIDTPTKDDRDNYLGLRIYDIIRVPLSISDDVDLDSEVITGRQYFGFQSLKILSVEPMQSENRVTITGKILPDYEPYRIYDFSGDDTTDVYDFSGDDTTDVYDFSGGD